MHLSKRLWGISRKEISAVSYCIMKIYELGFLWSANAGREITRTYQVNSRAEIRLKAAAIPKYEPDKIYRLDLDFNISKKAYHKLLDDIKKHAPRAHAKLTGKRAKPLERKKPNLKLLLEKAEKYMELEFDEKTFKEFDKKMRYAGDSYHGTTFYCNSGPFYSIDINCHSAKKAETLFELLAKRFNLDIEEQKVITHKKKDAWLRNAGNEKIHINATEGFRQLGITIYPEPGNEAHCYTKSKQYRELYYTALTPILIGLSKPKLIEIMQAYDDLGLKSHKDLWRNCRTQVCSDKEYIRKRKQEMHQDLVERLHKTGNTLLDRKRYHDFFKLASIANHALDRGDRTAKKTIYDCMGMEPDTYCISNHKMILKKES